MPNAISLPGNWSVKHRHCSSEHVRSYGAGRDPLQAGTGAGGVDVRGEGIEHLVAAGDTGMSAVQGREEPIVADG